jgi:hypothetical protein
MSLCVILAARRWSISLAHEHLIITGGLKTPWIAASAFPGIFFSKACVYCITFTSRASAGRCACPALPRHASPVHGTFDQEQHCSIAVLRATFQPHLNQVLICKTQSHCLRPDTLNPACFKRRGCSLIEHGHCSLRDQVDVNTAERHQTRGLPNAHVIDLKRIVR